MNEERIITNKKVPICRNCSKRINLSPEGCTYGESREHFYGGYVCSDECEEQVTQRMKKSQDSHTTRYGW